MYRNILFSFCILLLAHSSLADDEKEPEEEKSGPEVKIEVLQKPEGECERFSVLGDILGVYYTGTLAKDGTVFDSLTRDESNEPFEFQLGGAAVVIGFDDGLTDMCVGEKRKLSVPASLGFGEYGSRDGKVGKGEDLIFEVELVEIKDGPKPTNVFKEIDVDGDNMLSQDEVSGFIRKQEKEHEMETAPDNDHNEMVADIFDHEDNDRDGFISHDEFGGPKHEEL